MFISIAIVAVIVIYSIYTLRKSFKKKAQGNCCGNEEDCCAN